MVNLAAPINARQMEVLRWIAAGCPDGGMKNFTYKTTAVALQGRRLVTVSRKGGTWRAEATDAGQHYLQHGTYPGDRRPAPSARSRPSVPAAKIPAGPDTVYSGQRPAATPVHVAPEAAIGELAQTLVARALRAGGVLEVDSKADATDYQSLIIAAGQAPNLPFGKQLRYRAKATCLPGPM